MKAKDYFDAEESPVPKNLHDFFLTKEQQDLHKISHVKQKRKTDLRIKGFDEHFSVEDPFKLSSEEFSYAVPDSSSVIEETNVFQRFKDEKDPRAFRVVEEKKKKKKRRFDPKQFSLARKPQALRTVQDDTVREVGNR